MFDADLHIHGRFSGGVSKRLAFKEILLWAKKKGIKLIGSGDILQPNWREEVKENIVEEGDAYVWEEGEIFVLPQVEVEDMNRVHHIIVFRSFEDAEWFQEKLDFDASPGRPRLKISGRDLVELLDDVEALWGPAHAFTPYFGIYAHTDSILEYYGERPYFLELGLSADTSMADRIKELAGIPFLSNSDAHSGKRLAREFQRLEGRPGFQSLKKMKIVFNAGLDPREGKYHLTACNRCHRRYTITAAERLRWRCPCGGKIKKGVKDRVDELSSDNTTKRPPYYHIIPLQELLSLLNKPQDLYNILLEEFGSEIAVLLDVPTDEISDIDEDVASAIEMMRNDKIVYFPGGGGEYGRPYIPLNEEDYEKIKDMVENELGKMLKVEQRSLFEFI